MNNINYSRLLILAFILIALLLTINTPDQNPRPAPQPRPITPLTDIQWINCPRIRVVSETGVVGDVESHLPAGHGYDDADPITTVHESTHGINSVLRNLYGKPAFYCLNNKAVLIDEPKTTLSAVADIVPPSLRGEVYNLYLIQAQGDWNSKPTYTFDEFCAYTQGGLARKELGTQSRYETVRFSTEFIVYASTVPMASASNDPQMKGFLKFTTERVMSLQEGPSEYLDKLRTASDAEGLRKFMRRYYGQAWCKKILGF